MKDYSNNKLFIFHQMNGLLMIVMEFVKLFLLVKVGWKKIIVKELEKWLINKIDYLFVVYLYIKKKK